MDYDQIQISVHYNFDKSLPQPEVNIIFPTEQNCLEFRAQLMLQISKDFLLIDDPNLAEILAPQYFPAKNNKLTIPLGTNKSALPCTYYQNLDSTNKKVIIIKNLGKQASQWLSKQLSFDQLGLAQVCPDGTIIFNAGIVKYQPSDNDRKILTIKKQEGDYAPEISIDFKTTAPLVQARNKKLLISSMQKLMVNSKNVASFTNQLYHIIHDVYHLELHPNAFVYFTQRAYQDYMMKKKLLSPSHKFKKWVKTMIKVKDSYLVRSVDSLYENLEQLERKTHDFLKIEPGKSRLWKTDKHPIKDSSAPVDYQNSAPLKKA